MRAAQIIIRLAIWFISSCVIAQANVGSLQSMRSPFLTITSQDISLSLDQIKVNTVYTNTLAHEVIETMVFAQTGLITVNRAPIPVQTVQHAISANGRDISKELRSLGLPFDPIAAMHSIDSSSNRESIIAKLRNMQVIDQKEDTPTWKVHTYYYWQQVFPAHTSVSIEQIYKPNVVTSNVKFNNLTSLLKFPFKMIKKVVNIAIHWTLEDDAALTNLQDQFEKYWPRIQNFCPSKQDYQVLVNAYKHNPNKRSQLELKELNFTYAANEIWAHSVNRFNLTVESPKNMHALLCWNDEIKRTSNNTLHFTAENYIPLHNIAVLYIEK